METSELIALHEAGHAVAHVRLGIDQADVSIVSKDNSLGHSSSAGTESVWSEGEAEAMAIAYCAGYAAVVAAGHTEDVAVQGCEGDDFIKVDQLVEFWGLTGRGAWQAKAVDLMSVATNVAAVRLVADHLLRHKTLDAGYVEVLVTVADGETTAAELEQYLLMRQQWVQP